MREWPFLALSAPIVLEGRGVQLFERIEGDYFASPRLPLLELLGFLRAGGAVRS